MLALLHCPQSAARPVVFQLRSAVMRSPKSDCPDAIVSAGWTCHHRVPAEARVAFNSRAQSSSADQAGDAPPADAAQ
jgi:hypothetical protein